ncbi:MAG: hypothetical protein JJE04_09190 [Acidobacteriia bacterium]|nr:hypothetical protein [Terriglobia bacterium]
MLANSGVQRRFVHRVGSSQLRECRGYPDIDYTDFLGHPGRLQIEVRDAPAAERGTTFNRATFSPFVL